MEKEAKRSLIILYHDEGKSASVISKILSINRWIVYRTIKRYKETGSTQDRFRKGRPRSVRTPAVRKLVRERVRKNPVRSIQSMAKDFNITTRSMGKIVKEDLGLKCYKFRESLVAALKRRRRIRDGGMAVDLRGKWKARIHAKDTEGTAAKLPKLDTLKRTIQRQCASVLAAPVQPTTLAELALPAVYQQAAKGEQFSL
ncbi:hypothetical protein LOD99_3958 [Oopsacas minuta]|uniref:Uncharacterized protein n=1 Tax=Oopsacas minuta TaxID=111878 RepID=A0AAV7JWA3_9METZ|nr:hypothetical protein LOD99_3958 [Oopsacas minuta]